MRRSLLARSDSQRLHPRLASGLSGSVLTRLAIVTRQPARRRAGAWRTRPALRVRPTLRFGWAPPCGSDTTASHPRGARQSRAVPSVASSRVPDPPRGVAPPPGPRRSCAVQFQSAPVGHPWCADHRRACEDVQNKPARVPAGGGHPNQLLGRPTKRAQRRYTPRDAGGSGVCHVAFEQSWKSSARRCSSAATACGGLACSARVHGRSRAAGRSKRRHLARRARKR